MKNLRQLPNDVEVRYTSVPELKTEKTEEGGERLYVRGTPVKFGELSKRMAMHNSDTGKVDYFYEKFERGAFDDVIGDDVVAVFNHNMDLLLGRTSSRTLTLMQDEVGLHYEIDVPDNTAGRDLVVSLRRGDVTGSSFSFATTQDRWELDEEKRNIRTVEKANRLVDVSPVVFPAYPQSVSELAQRSYEEWRTELQKPSEQQKAIEQETESLGLDIELLKLQSEL